MISISKYQHIVTQVKKYPKGKESLYLLAKLTEESGELAKEIRKIEEGENSNKDLKLELGDLLWVITAIAEQNSISMDDVIQKNLQKLRERNLL